MKLNPDNLYLDIVECTNTTCSGNGDCIEKVGGGTECLCEAGYTSDNCSESKYTVCYLLVFNFVRISFVYFKSQYNY